MKFVIMRSAAVQLNRDVNSEEYMVNESLWYAYSLMIGANLVSFFGGMFMGWLLWKDKRKRFLITFSYKLMKTRYSWNRIFKNSRYISISIYVKIWDGHKTTVGIDRFDCSLTGGSPGSRYN